MGFDLQVPGDVLEETGAALGRLASEFEHAEDNAEALVDAVGEPRLAGAVEDFAGNWDSARGEIVSAIGKLDEVAKACAETFDKIERHFVRALERAYDQANRGTS
jgi:hypothetical protein